MARAATQFPTSRVLPIGRAARRRPVVRRVAAAPPPAERPPPPIANAQLGLLVFIAFETMIFVGLVTAYCVLRVGSFAWPPPDMPRLPLAVTWVNTAMLLFSAVTMSRAVAAVRTGSQDGLRSALIATGVLGVGFLAVQGSEWMRLIRHGLTLTSGSYGATFYTLIGLHALHVIGAAVWLLAILWLAQRRRFSPQRHMGVTLCATYWYFVCALWVILFGVVYLY